MWFLKRIIMYLLVCVLTNTLQIHFITRCKNQTYFYRLMEHQIWRKNPTIRVECWKVTTSPNVLQSKCKECVISGIMSLWSLLMFHNSRIILFFFHASVGLWFSFYGKFFWVLYFFLPSVSSANRQWSLCIGVKMQILLKFLVFCEVLNMYCLT